MEEQEKEQPVEPSQLKAHPQVIPPNDVLRMNLQEFLQHDLGSVLYGVSAISLLYGIAKIFGPALANGAGTMEKLPAFLSLNVYEFALLAVLLAIVISRRGLRDAVSLALLIGVLLAASGIALSAVVINAAGLAGLLGAVCLGLACAKLFLLRRWAGVAISPMLAASLVLVLAWHFLSPALIGELGHAALPGAQSLHVAWRIGWLAIAYAAVFVVLAPMARASGYDRPAPDTPLIFQPLIGWLLLALLLAGVGLHQYAMAYLYDLRVSEHDYLPMLLFAALFVSELLRSQGLAHAPAHATLCAAPLLLLAMSALPTAPPATDPLAMLWQFPVVCIFAAALIGARAYALRWPSHYLPASLYLGAGLLHAGAPAVKSLAHGVADQQHYFVLAIVFAVYLAALIKRQAALAYATLVVCALGINYYAASHYGGPARPAFVVLSVLLVCYGAIIIYAAVGNRFPTWIACAHALYIVVVQQGLPAAFDDTNAAWYIAGPGLLCCALLLRNRHFPLAACCCAPLLAQATTATGGLTPWHFIALAFLLLCAGAAKSLYQGDARSSQST